MPPVSAIATRAIRVARLLFLPLATIFLAYSAYRASGSFTPLLASVSYPKLLAAGACWGVAQWVGPLSTVAFARILRLPLGYRELSSIAVLRLPAKYLPGGIWQSVARFSAYRERDVKDKDSFTILVAEHVIALGVSMALGASIMLFFGNNQQAAQLALPILSIGLVLCAGTAYWFARKQPLRLRSVGWMLAAIGTAMLFWLLAASAFCAYWSALFDLRVADIPDIASCYLLSWAAGFLALFAPQGLGVFEWVAAQLLPSAQALNVTVTAVAGFRLVAITGDLSAWLLALLITPNLQLSDRQQASETETGASPRTATGLNHPCGKSGS